MLSTTSYVQRTMSYVLHTISYVDVRCRTWQESRWHLESPESLDRVYDLSYTCHMTCRVIYLSYDRYMTTFFVRTKLVFISCRMDIWHPSALLIYRMSLYMHRVHFFKSYKVSKINMEYDSHIPFIWMVHTRIIMILFALCFYCKCDHETTTASQILHIHMHP